MNNYLRSASGSDNKGRSERGGVEKEVVEGGGF